MKKTAITLAILCIAFIGNINATHITSKENVTETEFIAPPEINKFCMAIVKGDVATVKSLIEAGEKINKKSNGKTPIMYAARYNRIEIINLLLDNGAKLNRVCDNGMDALQYAEAAGAKEAVRILKQASN